MERSALAALRSALTVAHTLTRDYAYIADVYRTPSGETPTTMNEIIAAFQLGEVCSYLARAKLHPTTVREAVFLTLRGHAGWNSPGHPTIPPLEGLLGEKERKREARLRCECAGRQSREQGKGLFGLSAEERRENGIRLYTQSVHQRRGIAAQTTHERLAYASIGGRTAVRNRAGIHSEAFAREGRREALERSVRSRGFTPWSTDERWYATCLVRDPDVSYREVAFNCNTLFHNGKAVRTQAGVRLLTQR